MFFNIYRDFFVARIPIKEAVPYLYGKSIQYLIHERQKKVVLLRPSIQLSVVHPNSLSSQRLHGDILFSYIGYSINTTLFSHTLNMVYPTTICDGIDNSNIQPFDDLLQNYHLHRRIQFPLILDTRLIIWHDLNFVRKNTGRNTNNVRNSPSNISTRYSLESIPDILRAAP